MADDRIQGIYSITDELRAMAHLGLRFTKNEYDKERYEKILKMSAHLASILDDQPLPDVFARFRDNSEHLSPLLGVEAAIFRNSQILLMKRHDDGLWAVPGGLVEVGEVLTTAALRELKEESGLTSTITRLLGIFDSRIWKSHNKSHLYHVIFEVSVPENVQPVITKEARDWGFFSADELPELSPGHALRVPFLFRIMNGEIPAPYFDAPDIEVP